MAPAFLLACFAALRLAKFSLKTEEQQHYFIGMPTPAVGLFVGAFPLLLWNGGSWSQYFHSKWIIYLLIASLCYLMVSNIKFFKLMPRKWNLGAAWPQLVLILVSVVAYLFLGFWAVLVAFVAYILLSLVCKYPTEDQAIANDN